MHHYISEPRRLSLGWGSLAFLLGAAVLSAGGLGVFVGTTMSTSSSVAPSERIAGRSKLVASDHVNAGKTKGVVQERIYLPVVGAPDYEEALDSMGLSPQERRQMRGDIQAGKIRLLWLTLWDWDTQAEMGDTISIAVDDYRRIFTLSSHRTKIAIPEPKSGSIEFRGEHSEDGIIAISFLTGNRPIALPYMRPGEVAKVEIDTPG